MDVTQSPDGTKSKTVRRRAAAHPLCWEQFYQDQSESHYRPITLLDTVTHVSIALQILRTSKNSRTSEWGNLFAWTVKPDSRGRHFISTTLLNSTAYKSHSSYISLLENLSSHLIYPRKILIFNFNPSSQTESIIAFNCWTRLYSRCFMEVLSGQRVTTTCNPCIEEIWITCQITRMTSS